MKTIKREILKVGQYGRMGGQKVVITPEIIKDVKETFDGKCPCTIGHELADFMPKFGNVKSIEPESTDASIVSQMDVHDILADAIDEKFYEDTSVGIERNLQGKYYLHHNAFLGAIPPKIRDLKVFADLDIVCLADGPAIELSTPEARAQAAQRIMDAKRSAGFSLDSIQKAITDLANWLSEMAMAGTGELPADLQDPFAQLADRLAGIKKPKSNPKEGDDVEMKEENDQLRKDLADKNDRILAAEKATLVQAMDGRIPKAKQGEILALADKLMAVDSIELSDTEGKKTSVTAFEVLKRVFESIPKPVGEGRTDLGDAETQGKEKPITVDFSKA